MERRRLAASALLDDSGFGARRFARYRRRRPRDVLSVVPRRSRLQSAWQRNKQRRAIHLSAHLTLLRTARVRPIFATRTNLEAELCKTSMYSAEDIVRSGDFPAEALSNPSLTAAVVISLADKGRLARLSTMAAASRNVPGARAAARLSPFAIWIPEVTITAAFVNHHQCPHCSTINRLMRSTSSSLFCFR